jgi:hypothetical protein
MPDASEQNREALSRFVVGIDLGTTNCAVCAVQTDASDWRVETFPVPQLVAPHQVESRETLPSFHYQSARGEFPPEALALPWNEPARSNRERREAVGVLAREQGKLMPGRVIESAKSWLCHPGVDRTAPLLPWHGAEEVERLSPVEASAACLEHIRHAWNHAHPHDPLEEQEVVITLPASFDEVARKLTVEAAQRAGLPRVILIEEPQAAFYAWIHAHSENWHQLVTAGQNILVCDVGGGTSDFTLIRVRSSKHASDGPGNAPPETGDGSEATVQFQRVAVGDHLLLGGDNLDLALAHHLERKLSGDSSERRLEPRQWGMLVRLCRHVKETLLSEQAPESCTVTLPGAGSRLIGGGLSVEVTREEAVRVLLEGFFPRVPLNERPQPQRSGFQEFGLPYAPDPGVTRYLAAFLSDHCRSASRVENRASSVESSGVKAGTPDHTQLLQDESSSRPDVVLFNGGVFVSPLIRRRVIEVLREWFAEGEEWEPVVLANDRHDLAVARGAAYYGMVRRGIGVRIAAGLPRTYYIGVATAGGERDAGDEEASTTADRPGMRAMCLMPAGAEGGDEVALEERTFELTVGAPVEFPLFYSSTRLTDPPGTLVPIEQEQLSTLPPVRTVLKSRKHRESATIPVHLHSRLTELGTLEVWCSEAVSAAPERGTTEAHADSPRKGRTWQLQFDVRSAVQTDRQAHQATGEAAGLLDAETVETCRNVLENVFGPQGREKPAGLPKRLAREMQMSRDQWPPSLLRQMWEMLIELESARHKSAEHEARWLNLLGFALRPGFGVALDDWRVAETWKRLRGKLHHPGPTCIVEWWILWRRIAAGLSAGQQQSLAQPLVTGIREDHRKSAKRARSGKPGKPRRGSSTHEQAEAWRMFGALEQLPVSNKVELGEVALDFLDDPDREAVHAALLWAIGRMGAREPFAGPLNGVLSAETAARWLERLLRFDGGAPVRREWQWTVTQLARRTEDRYRDIDASLRDRVGDWLTAGDAPDHFITLVRTGGALEGQEASLVFGESLPVGLRVI